MSCGLFMPLTLPDLPRSLLTSRAYLENEETSSSPRKHIGLAGKDWGPGIWVPALYRTLTGGNRSKQPSSWPFPRDSRQVPAPTPPESLILQMPIAHFP